MYACQRLINFFFFLLALILHSDYFVLLNRKKKKSLDIESKTSCNKGKSMAPSSIYCVEACYRQMLYSM